MGQHAHLYGSRWRKARKIFLADNPLCVMCRQAGKVTAATVVDHITQHGGDLALFWDSRGNWQALCATHHNATKQRQERRGHEVGSDASGKPLDAGHHWNRPPGGS